MSDIAERLKAHAYCLAIVNPDVENKSAILMREAADFISDSTSRWIWSGDRMPKDGQLIAIRYSPDSDTYDAFRYTEGVQGFSHWTPLPEAPK